MKFNQWTLRAPRWPVRQALSTLLLLALFAILAVRPASAALGGGGVFIPGGGGGGTNIISYYFPSSVDVSNITLSAGSTPTAAISGTSNIVFTFSLPASPTNVSRASYATNAGTASFATNATYASLATNATWSANATNANWAASATNASYATNAGTANLATNAIYAGLATNATYAANATNATYAGGSYTTNLIFGSSQTNWTVTIPAASTNYIVNAALYLYPASADPLGTTWATTSWLNVGLVSGVTYTRSPYSIMGSGKTWYISCDGDDAQFLDATGQPYTFTAAQAATNLRLKAVFTWHAAP